MFQSLLSHIKNDDVNMFRTVLYSSGAELVEFVLNYVVDTPDFTKCSLLHYASSIGNLEICKLLLDRGADIELKMPRVCHTPLHRASIEGNLQMCEMFVDYGANVNARTISGYTMYTLARENNQYKVMDYFKNMDQFSTSFFPIVACFIFSNFCND